MLNLICLMTMARMCAGIAARLNRHVLLSGFYALRGVPLNFILAMATFTRPSMLLFSSNLAV